MDEKLIAPCGMNCGVCISFLVMKNNLNKQGFKKAYCEGCLPRGKNCLHMGDQCEVVGKGLVRFCYECNDFPCKRLKALDKRYRTKHHMSMIENLRAIKEHGIENFLIKEEEKCILRMSISGKTILFGVLMHSPSWQIYYLHMNLPKG